jgi:hypothetical protein
MNEKIMNAGTKLDVRSDRLFFLLGGKAMLGKRLLSEGDFLYFSAGHAISSASANYSHQTIDVLETMSLFEIEMKIVRRKPTNFWNFGVNFMSDHVNKIKH